MDDLAYTIRISPRARRVALRVMPHGAVEVVLPRGVSHALVPEFVARNRDWIAQTRARLHAASRVAPEMNVTRPGKIVLAAIGEIWRVDYQTTATRTRVRTGETILCLPDGDNEEVRAGLRRWLHRRAVACLEPWLRRLAHEYNFAVNKVSIRAQRSRWGSCSSKGNVNLNSRLLFLAPEVVHYLLVHELCHTVHLNHSPEYWTLVEQLEPRWKLLDRRLREGFHEVPLWAYPD